MKRLLIAAALALSLGGCAGLLNTYETVSGSAVSERAVYIAVNAFNATKVTATNYLRQPKCNGTRPICRSPAATRVIIPAVRSGTFARDHLEAFMRNNPGKLGPIGTYNALISADETLKQIYLQYRINQ